MPQTETKEGEAISKRKTNSHHNHEPTYLNYEIYVHERLNVAPQCVLYGDVLVNEEKIENNYGDAKESKWIIAERKGIGYVKKIQVLLQFILFLEY